MVIQLHKFVPDILKWARERAGLDIASLANKMKVTVDTVKQWETTGELSLPKARKLASYTRTHFGYLFLEMPLSDKLPIPDFRTVADTPLGRPSPDLLEIIQTMQRRQECMRDLCIEDGADKLSFVGSVSINNNPAEIAKKIRNALGISTDWAKSLHNWVDALRHLRERIETVGILIFISGIVDNNTHRKLDTAEFRGFVICDDYAPLIFINGSDFQSAQMFTIAHELAHVWIGEDGVSNFEKLNAPDKVIELFCNKVAAEFLIPGEELENLWPKIKNSQNPFDAVARQFKVSQIVAARRCLDLNYITRNRFFEFYEDYIKAERRDHKKKSGGDFWKTQNIRLGNRFGTMVVIAAKEGRILYHDAYKLTGLKGATFEKFAKNIGFPLL